MCCSQVTEMFFSQSKALLQHPVKNANVEVFKTVVATLSELGPEQVQINSRKRLYSSSRLR